MKKSILSKTAFIALATMMIHSYASHNETKMESLSHAFTAAENDLSLFVDQSNNTSFNTYIISLGTTLQKLQRTVEEITRAHDDELSKEIDALVHYVLQQFNILLDVFKRYNGKSADYALSFSAEINQEFDVKKIFAETINKLKALRTKAQQAGHKHLVKQIEEFATKIQHKQKIWNGKTNLALLTGLVHRMKCK